MKYLKAYKIFESSIIIHTPYKYVMDYYLKELGVTLDELNDIFIGFLDLNFDSYLQLFYLDKNGSRWSRIPDVLSEEHPVFPYLSISFEREGEIESTIKNSTQGRSNVYSSDTNFLESCVDSIHRLKSMFPEREIYWKIKDVSGLEVCIYFDKITEEPSI